MSFRLRFATVDDELELRALIARSARLLSLGEYTPEQVEGALRGSFGVDSQLVLDRTYFVVEEDGKIIGCGGWSKRRTLFGGNAHTVRDATELDPATDAARIRAFFVDPDHARRGIGRALLERCELEAQAKGFRKFELAGTLPGVRFYTAMGYSAGELFSQPLGDGLSIDFIRMTRQDTTPRSGLVLPN
ncbi:N-acetyltransferase [Mycena metata]|uniref:N-acetyltransferase n=1 Tax=Mycena metata TaxID=1033252 RepID=A0AAD7NHC7_9AGAR|nr:N-acetyltransferase [Mycena metata]